MLHKHISCVHAAFTCNYELEYKNTKNTHAKEEIFAAKNTIKEFILIKGICPLCTFFLFIKIKKYKIRNDGIRTKNTRLNKITPYSETFDIAKL